MRVTRFAFAAAAAIASAGVVAACSNGGSSMPQSIVPNHSGSQSVVRTHEPTGVAPRFLGLLRFNVQRPRPNPNVTTPPTRMAVTDFGTGATEILGPGPGYAYKRSITTGMNGPDGDWMDSGGRLYVAQFGGVNIVEYFAHGSVPIFTYTTNLIDPIDVTTDELNNVYAADYDDSAGSGFVIEFPQMSNTPSYQCPVNGNAEGVAVGETGQVFVTYNDPSSGLGRIEEFPHGLAGCHGKVLAPTIGFAGGIQVANNRALIVNDQTAPSVDTIPAPYTAITSSINPGYIDSFHVALSKTNGLMFVADAGSGTVWVQTYPGGTVLTQLNGSQNISDAAGVAVYPFLH